MRAVIADSGTKASQHPVFTESLELAKHGVRWDFRVIIGRYDKRHICRNSIKCCGSNAWQCIRLAVLLDVTIERGIFLFWVRACTCSWWTYTVVYPEVKLFTTSTATSSFWGLKLTRIDIYHSILRPDTTVTRHPRPPPFGNRDQQRLLLTTRAEREFFQENAFAF
jgi:hypothetical protein